MNSKIVGHKVVRYLTKQHQRIGKDWWIVDHQVIVALHATKGWRVIRREAKIHTVTRLPSRRQWLAAFITQFVRLHKTSPRMTRYGVPVLKGIRP